MTAPNAFPPDPQSNIFNQPGPEGVRAAFANQVAYCTANDAPLTAAVCDALSKVLRDDSQFGRAVLAWSGKPMADGVPLRCAAAFHDLYLTGKHPALNPLYAGGNDALGQADSLICEAIKRHDGDLLPWLDTPPQTNESGRSANFMAAMQWLAKQGLPNDFEICEIGSSAGINLMMDRYHYNLGGTLNGPDNAAMRLAPIWHGPPPPAQNISIASLRGVDLTPLDLTDEAQAQRLKAYIWPENRDRFARMEAAIAAAQLTAPHLEQGDAADFVECAIAKPIAPHTTRILMHSIVWVYLPDATQNRIIAAMEEAGAQASKDAPLAWIMLESSRYTLRHELKVRYWPDPHGKEWHKLAESHAHGQWVKWMAED